MADAERALAEHGPELELDRGRIGERAFRADEDMGEVVRGRVRQERVEIVAADAALHLGKARRDLVGLALADGEKPLDELGLLRVRARVRAPPAATGPKCIALAIGEHGVDRDDIVAHRAVAQRAAAAGVVARHAADRGARGGRDVDREPEPMRASRSRLSSSSTMPGSTTQRRAATSSETRRSDASSRRSRGPQLIVWPHCEVPAPRGVTANALLARQRRALARPRPSSSARRRRAASSDNGRRRSRNGRARSGRRATSPDDLAPQPSLEPGPHAVRHAFRPLPDRADRAIKGCFVAPMKSARKRDGKEKPGSRRAESRLRLHRDAADRVPENSQGCDRPSPGTGTRFVVPTTGLAPARLST